MLPLILLTALCLLFTGCQPCDCDKPTRAGGACRITDEMAMEAVRRSDRTGRDYVNCLYEVCDEEIERQNKEYEVVNFPLVDAYRVQFDGKEWRRVE